ncbi:hypothetical protein CcaverHIS002_0302190 [Cutaneotrichosporon cavernicola]|nr:hypothetical protein CcaverHIS002_0302190 [Cutaneotrichosporon cavernicola]
MPDIHLFLLIHGLWGRPVHLAEAKAELEAAWNRPTPPTSPSRSGTPCASPSLSDDSDSTMVDSFAFTARDDLVVVVAQGMTAKLTYDGVDVCASRVAWEVDQHIAALEADGRHVARISILGYSLGGLVARYLVGLLAARTPNFFDKITPVSFTTIATPHLGVPRYKYVWHQALSRFAQVHIYANIVNDNTVPYPSAAIEPIDPFVQWVERGLEVTAHHAIASTWKFPNPGSPRRKVRFHLGNLPPTLRFRWPYSWVILALFPVFLPLIALFVFSRFSLDTLRSRLRLQRLARSYANTNLPSDGEAALIPSPHGQSIDGLRAAIRVVERSLEQDLMDAADHADTGPSPPEVEPDSPTYPEPTIKALLTDRQLLMIHWLNQLAPRRHLAWFPRRRQRACCHRCSRPCQVCCPRAWS